MDCKINLIQNQTSVEFSAKPDTVFVIAHLSHNDQSELNLNIPAISS
jgi:hypothetical protein